MNEFGEPMGGDFGYEQDGFNMDNYRGPKDNYFFSMDYNLMLTLGFTPMELTVLQNAVDFYGLVSTQKLSTPPFCVGDYTSISRIMYAYNICMGKKIVDVGDIISISKHFKNLARISGNTAAFSCFYIDHRTINKIPRTAVVAGLPKGSFYTLNSKLYDKMESTYKVDKIAQEWVTIQSTRKMAVGAADRLNDSYSNREWGIPDILKVEEVGSFAENKPWVLKIHKTHCRLCNRFMIMISTKKMVPGVTVNHGGYALVVADGTIVYVYAKTTDFDAYGNPKDSVPATTKDTTVFDYGFYASEIGKKIDAAIAAVAAKNIIVYSLKLTDDIPFEMIPKYNGMEQIRGVSTASSETAVSDETFEDDIDADIE